MSALSTVQTQQWGRTGIRKSRIVKGSEQEAMRKGLDSMDHLPSHHYHPLLPTINIAPLNPSPSSLYCFLVACEATSDELSKNEP